MQGWGGCFIIEQCVIACATLPPFWCAVEGPALTLRVPLVLLQLDVHAKLIVSRRFLLIVFIDLMGFGIVLPNLQLYGLVVWGFQVVFHADAAGGRVLLRCASLCLRRFWGKWSDRIGRRPVLILSQAGTVAGFLILFAAHWFESADPGVGIAILFASRIIDGISGGNISTASAYIADITTPENRAKGMGVIGAAFGLGFVLGPAIGGVVGKELGLEWVPIAAALFSVWRRSS